MQPVCSRCVKLYVGKDCELEATLVVGSLSYWGFGDVSHDTRYLLDDLLR